MVGCKLVYSTPHHLRISSQKFTAALTDTSCTIVKDKLQHTESTQVPNYDHALFCCG